MSNAAKDIRKQVRNVVKEVLPEILKDEIINSLYNDVLKHVNRELDAIKKRTDDVQAYVINRIHSEMTKNAPKVAEVTVNTDSTLLSGKK